MFRWKKVSDWPDLPLVAAGVIVIVDEIALVLASLAGGFEESFETVEAFVQAICKQFSQLALSLNGFTLIPLFMLATVTGVLWVFRHPRPWRAISETALVFFIPFAVWSVCYVISRCANGTGFHLSPPAWFSWPIVSYIGSVATLCGLFICAAARCVKQWFTEVGVDCSGMAALRGLTEIYHGE